VCATRDNSWTTHGPQPERIQHHRIQQALKAPNTGQSNHPTPTELVCVNLTTPKIRGAAELLISFLFHTRPSYLQSSFIAHYSSSAFLLCPKKKKMMMKQIGINHTREGIRLGRQDRETFLFFSFALER
jgi:hypothetical protein